MKVQLLPRKWSEAVYVIKIAGLWPWMVEDEVMLDGRRWGSDVVCGVGWEGVVECNEDQMERVGG